MRGGLGERFSLIVNDKNIAMMRSVANTTALRRGAGRKLFLHLGRTDGRTHALTVREGCWRSPGSGSGFGLMRSLHSGYTLCTGLIVESIERYILACDYGDAFLSVTP